MKIDMEKQSSPVLRMTIDERLADGLIRVLIAYLKDDVTAFDDDSESWGEEKELLLQPESYPEKIDLTQSDAEEWPWDKLQEGQVFLLGRFRVNRSQKALTMFRVAKRRKRFQRIDPLIKDRVKKQYLTALERSVSNGEANQTQ